MDAMTPTDIQARLATVRQARQGKEATLNTIRAYLRPDTPSFTNQRRPETVKRSHILDNLGEEASEVLASYIYGALFPQDMKFFEFGTTDGEGDRLSYAAKLHLEDDTTQMREKAFADPNSNFTSAMSDWLQDFVDFAYAVVFIEEKPGQPPIFNKLDPAECYLVQSSAGIYTELWRAFRLTAKQALEDYPTGLSQKVIDAAGDPKSMDQEFDFVHAVYPRADGVAEDNNPKKKPWASVTFDVSGAKVVRESGYSEQPFMAAAWSGRLYGRGPGERAINSIILLQRELACQIEGAETLMQPPVVVPDDGILGNIKMYRGAVMVARSEWLMAGRNPIQPVSTGARVDIAEAMIDGVRERIRSHFYNDKLLMGRDPRMTATQTLEEKETLSKIMAKPFSRIEKGLLAVMMPRVHGILRHNGWLKEPPADLIDVPVKVKYLSLFARQQQVTDARAISQYMEVGLQLDQIDPGVRARTIDLDKASAAVADALGVPMHIRVSPRDAAAMKEQDRQARSQAQQTDTAVKMANAAAQAGAASERMSRAGAPAN